MYREHIPEIKLSDDTRKFLDRLKAKGGGMGLITDGRSVTQRNKLKALQVLDLFDDLIISEEFGSEKPDPANYRYFEDKYPGSRFYFFGDNTIKDFIIPVQLGWTSICIKDAGENIHPQDIGRLSPDIYLVDRLSDIELI
jgi:putative hydrolase of the HAD superfamily